MSWRKRWALRVLGINKTADYGIYLVNQHGLTRCSGGPDSVARAIAAEQYDPEIEDDLDCIKPRYTTDSNTGTERIREAINKSRGGRPTNPPAQGWS